MRHVSGKTSKLPTELPPIGASVTQGSATVTDATGTAKQTDVFGAEAGTGDSGKLNGQAPEAFVQATLTNFVSQQRSISKAVDRLEAPVRASALRPLLARIETARANFDHPGLAAAAVDSGQIDSVRDAVTELATQLSNIEDKLTSITPATKAGAILTSLVQLQLQVTDLSEHLRAETPDIENSQLTGQIAVQSAEKAEGFKRIGWAHYNKGKVAKEAGHTKIADAHFSEALKSLERMNKADPSNVDTQSVFFNRSGMVLHQQGDDKGALELYAKAQELHDGKYLPAHYNAASSHVALGDAGAAIESLQSTVEFAKDEEQANFMRGLAAKDEDLRPLVGFPLYQVHVDPVGGSQLTKMEPVEGQRQTYKTDAWRFEMNVFDLGMGLVDLVGILEEAREPAPEGRQASRLVARLHFPDGSGGPLMVEPHAEDDRQGLRVFDGEMLFDPEALKGATITVTGELSDGISLVGTDVATAQVPDDSQGRVAFDVPAAENLAANPYPLLQALGRYADARTFQP